MEIPIKIYKSNHHNIGVDMGGSAFYLNSGDLFEYNGSRITKIISKLEGDILIDEGGDNLIYRNSWYSISGINRIFGDKLIEDVTEQIFRDRKINDILEYTLKY